MRLLLLLFAAIAAIAQPVPQDHYVATASTTALTIQQPTVASGNGRQITFGNATVAGASVYCASAATATIKWNGAAATATAGTELKLPGTFQSSGVTVWTASNVGNGTVGPVFNVPAGGTMNFDLTWFRFGTQGNTANITIATSGTCTITFAYSAI